MPLQMTWKALRGFNKTQNISWLIFTHSEFAPQHQKPQIQTAFLNKWYYESVTKLSVSILGSKQHPQQQRRVDAGSHE